MILVEIGGASVYAISFSNMGVYVASLSAGNERYLEKIQSISEQMRHLDLSIHMQKKVEMYFEYLYLRHKALLDDDEEEEEAEGDSDSEREAERARQSRKSRPRRPSSGVAAEAA